MATQLKDSLAASGGLPQPAELNEMATALTLARRGVWLFALYNTISAREAAIAELGRRVQLPQYLFQFSPGNDNPLAYTITIPTERRAERAVIHFVDIERVSRAQAEESSRASVLGYLDLNREEFLLYPHSLVFWVTEQGRTEVARGAPNFWSRRTAVFDLRLSQPDPAKLRQILASYFNEGELRDLCFSLRIDYDNLSGPGKADRARELVAYSERHGLVAELAQATYRLRPNTPR